MTGVAEAPYVFPSEKLTPLHEVPPGTSVVAVLASCGSYNPIHTAHISMFHQARRAVERGDVLVAGAFASPVNDAYGKAGLAPFAVRLAACRLALQTDALISVDDWEGRQPEYVRSYVVLSHIYEEVVQYYRSQLPAGVSLPFDVRLCFVCGGDLFETFYRPNCWRLSLLRKIFDEFVVVVAARVGSKDPREVVQLATEPIVSDQEPEESLDLTPYAGKIVVFEIEPNETSSTVIRKLFAAGEDVPEHMLPKSVAQFLRGVGVYSATMSDR